MRNCNFHMHQGVAVCYSVLSTQICVPHLRNKLFRLIRNHIYQCVAVCCNVLQCVAHTYMCSTSSKQSPSPHHKLQLQYTSVCCSVFQCVAVFSSVLQCVAVCCSRICVFHIFETKSFASSKTAPSIYISVLQCVAVCCSVLHKLHLPYTSVHCSVSQCVAV